MENLCTYSGWLNKNSSPNMLNEIKRLRRMRRIQIKCLRRMRRMKLSLFLRILDPNQKKLDQKSTS